MVSTGWPKGSVRELPICGAGYRRVVQFANPIPRKLPMKTQPISRRAVATSLRWRRWRRFPRLPRTRLATPNWSSSTPRLFALGPFKRGLRPGLILNLRPRCRRAAPSSRAFTQFRRERWTACARSAARCRGCSRIRGARARSWRDVHHEPHNRFAALQLDPSRLAQYYAGRVSALTGRTLADDATRLAAFQPSPDTTP